MPGMNLLKAEAQERAGLVSHVAYTVVFDFTQPGDTFHTTTTAVFDAAPGTSTFIERRCVRLAQVEGPENTRPFHLASRRKDTGNFVLFVR